MPWTEELGNPQALRIRQAQTRLAAALDIRFQAMNVDQALRDLAVNALANEEAMEMLHHGFAGMPRRRFLPDLQQHDHILRTSSLPGVLVHVLGPSHDEDVVRDMDPPAGQSYLRLAGDGTDIGKLPEPFSTDWVMESPSLSLSPEDEKAIQRVNEGREEGLAAQLDKAVNGTSLMLLFQIGEAYLLFPGDAQWGTWKAVLNDSDTQRLLDKVTFYKIGHHGSHNATPITFVEKHLSNRKHGDLWAMLSVRPYARWPDIPRVPLLDRLLQCTDKLARSDVDTPPEGFTRETDLWVETTIPTTRKEELRAPE